MQRGGGRFEAFSMAQQCAVVAARLSFGRPSPRLVTACRQTARYLKPSPAIAIHKRYFNNIFNKTAFPKAFSKAGMQKLSQMISK